MAETDRFPGWIKDKNGNITVYPLMGCQTAVFAGMGCMLRLEFARSLDQIRKTGEVVQLAMTPAQARELSQALSQMADKIDLSVPPDAKRS